MTDKILNGPAHMEANLRVPNFKDFWLPTRLTNPLHDSYLGVYGWPSVPCVAKLLEVNSSPGLEGIEKTTQQDIAGKIISYIERNVNR